MGKTCTICHQEKSISEFSPRKGVKDGLYSRCKKCHNEEIRKRYKYNPDYDRQRNLNKRKYLMDICNKIKSERGCKICKENDPCCLDFHHINPAEKDFSIAHIIGTKNVEKMMIEITKCIVVCANCHRKIHAGKLTTDVMAA